jgi:riboflavin transporter FmnP
MTFMTWFERHPIRKDSRSISLLAIFAAMVVALEVFPIVGVTDFGLPGNFTFDWTGIPIVIVFLGLGLVFSLVTIAAMWIAIAYRNPVGAAFKGFAEFYTILGLVIAGLVVRRFSLERKIGFVIYLTCGTIFRIVGMFFTNIFLLQYLYTLPPEVAVAGSFAYIVPNLAQAISNIVGGFVLYYLIPENLALQAGLGDGADSASSRFEELPPDEISDSPSEETSLTSEAG